MEIDLKQCVGRFFVQQSRRVAAGVIVGSLLSIIVHLLVRDSVFLAAVRLEWSIPLRTISRVSALTELNFMPYWLD